MSAEDRVLSRARQVWQQDASPSETAVRLAVDRAARRLRLRKPRMSDEFDWRGARWLAARYSCPGHDVPMHLFVTADRAAAVQSASLGWDEVHKGPLQVHMASGDHMGMVTEPHVHALAELVSSTLQNALEAAQSRSA